MAITKNGASAQELKKKKTQETSFLPLTKFNIHLWLKLSRKQEEKEHTST